MNATRLSSAAVRRIDQLCDQFEAAWKSGQRPDPAAYLVGAERDERAALLRQLLLLDWDYRLRAGDTPQAADYDTRFPGDSALVADVSREAASASSSPPEAVCVEEAESPSGVIGSRYDLRQEVGQGGVGVVFRAHDQHLGRDLAVKVLRGPYRDRPDVQRRFVAEGRVGSQLQHPGIVPVYELGTCADRGPFITMKLVEGHTLAVLLRDRPEPGHDLPRFLGVFVQVCQAIAYAHDHGILHRDLKPQNVMVGAFGEVQVMDWGLAKSVVESPESTISEPCVAATRSGASDHTQAGLLMGTPAYMPPEQARGESAHLDPRSDVFALGAILCQILTGQPPYVSDSNEETCRLAARGELAGAFARLDHCGADSALRALAKRCLAADRAARPADARDVGRDVTAYLNSAEERLRRAEVARAAAEARAAGECRARRLMVALAAVLLVGAGVAAWQAVVATHARRDAVNAAEREGEAKRAAQAAAASETTAKQKAVAKEAETRAVLDFVERRILAAGRPKGSGGLGADVSLWEAIEAAESHIARSFQDQPLTEARIRRTLGGALHSQGQGRPAAVQFEAAKAIYERVLGPDEHDTLVITDRLATSYVVQGRTQDAVALWEELLRKCRAKHGPDAGLTRSCLNNLAAGYLRLDQLDKAEVMLKDLLELTSKSGPSNRETLLARTNLAAVYTQQKQHEKALELGIPTWKAMTQTLGERDEHTLTAAQNIAINYRKLQKYDEALKYDEETLRLRIEKLSRGHPDAIKSVCALAENYVLSGRGAEAVPRLDGYIRASKGQPVHPNFVHVVEARLRISERANDAAGCRATAELWEAQGCADFVGLHAAARCRAVTAALLRASNAGREADAEADRAMAWLTKAKAAGLREWAKVRNDEDFAVLRDRPDFQKLTGAAP